MSLNRCASTQENADPNPYRIWLDVDTSSWCSPYSGQIPSELVEDLSPFSETSDAEAYYLLEDVHQILREHGKRRTIPASYYRG